MGVTTLDEIGRLCPYRPVLPLFRLCRVLLCHRSTRPLLRGAYLLLKGIYVRKMTAKG